MGDATKSIILRDAEVRAVLAGRATVRRAIKIPWIAEEFRFATLTEMARLTNPRPRSEAARG